MKISKVIEVTVSPSNEIECGFCEYKFGTYNTKIGEFVYQCSLFSTFLNRESVGCPALRCEKCVNTFKE